ncbi:MAG: hypothetical protein CBC36_02525 [Verrucomicrobiaceae bacterium TMED76]|nr:MAG: hypothetical protein CBC36_02525 [Verrucomicrobiaceae bacterium TMED76]
MGKESIIKTLKSLKEKRLFSSEAEKLVAPLKGKKGSFNFEIIESSRTLGRQLDSAYDNGHQLIVKFGDDLQSAILIPEKDSESLGELIAGYSMSMDLKFLGYDSLYQRAVFGKVNSDGSSQVLPVTEEVKTSEDEKGKGITEEEIKPPEHETSLAGHYIEDDTSETKDSEFHFPKGAPEQQVKTINDYYHIILEEVPKDETLPHDSNGYTPEKKRKIIGSYIERNLVPEFKFTWDNFKMWSINNFLSLHTGLMEANSILQCCPALIKSGTDELEARVIQNELKKYDAITTILSHDEFINTFGDAKKRSLYKKLYTINKIPEIPTVTLNFKTLRTQPKDHLLNLRFMDLIALLLYCLGGIITIFGVNDLSQTLFGSLIFFLGIICHKGFNNFLQDKSAKNNKDEIYGTRWKTSIQYQEMKHSLFINFIGYFFCIIGGIIIWSGITDIKNLIIGILSFSFGRWSWPWITENIERK